MRALGRAMTVAVLAGTLMLAAGVAAAAAEPLKVVMGFDGTGTFSAANGAGTDTAEHADVALKWSTTDAGDLQSDGSITFTATGPGAPGEVLQTTAPPAGTYHFTTSNAPNTADCSGSLPAAPKATRAHPHRLGASALTHAEAERIAQGPLYVDGVRHRPEAVGGGPGELPRRVRGV